MAKKGTWKAKYKREWRAFEKRRELARSRGYILPLDIALITQARGGYRQAYERIHRYTQVQIQRESEYAVPYEDGVGVQYVRGGRIMAQQREYRRKYGHSTQDFYNVMQRQAQDAKFEASYRAELRERERERQRVENEIRAIYLSMYGEEPYEEEPYEDIEMSEETMAQEDVRRSIIEEVEFYLDLIQNKSLKYKLKKLYAKYIVNEYWDTLNNLKDESSSVISLLQEAATVPYYTKGVSQEFLDELEAKETRIAGDFERFLKGSYTDSDRKDNAERS